MFQTGILSKKNPGTHFLLLQQKSFTIADIDAFINLLMTGPETRRNVFSQLTLSSVYDFFRFFTNK